MKFQITSLFAAALLAGSAAAHSWLECVDTDVPNHDAAQADPRIDPINNCKGYPRNKIYQGDWITESSLYVWDLNSSGNTLACRPLQTSTYPPQYPMTVAKPGDPLRLRFWGNGHSRSDIGSPPNRDPGVVRVYWVGKKEVEITDKSELTQANWLPGWQGNFSADTVNLITNGKMNEKANYFTLRLPTNIENGVHKMVWVWAWTPGVGLNPAGFNPATDYNNEWDNSYSTCFDIEIVGSTYTGATFDNSNQKVAAPNTICATGSGLKGGMTQYPCTGAECPPCWYKTATGANCFDYDSTGKCPFGGAFDCKLNKQLRRAMKHERAPFA